MTAVARPDVVEQIGNTPLIELRSFSTKNVTLYAKLEWHNPFGSVKDRAAYWMIKHAERKGILKKDKSIIIEPSSGNTGIALAGIAAALGYKVEIVIPEKLSEETKNILRDLGATLHETSDDLCPRVGAGTDQSIALAKAISKPRPDIYYMPNQYDNDTNLLSHYESTGPETFLKEKNKNVRAIAIQAQKNHLLQGLRNFEESAIPELFKRRLGVVDEWMTATNKDSFEAVRQLVEKETMLVGPSSGSVMASMLKVAHNLDHGIIVGIFADDGRKFRSLYIRENVLTEQEYDSALKSAKYLSKLAYS